MHFTNEAAKRITSWVRLKSYIVKLFQCVGFAVWVEYFLFLVYLSTIVWWNKNSKVRSSTQYHVTNGKRQKGAASGPSYSTVEIIARIKFQILLKIVMILENVRDGHLKANHGNKGSVIECN